MKEIKCQFKSVLEVAKNLRKDGCYFDDESSRQYLAMWLEELHAYRIAGEQIRIHLADVDRQVDIAQGFLSE